MYPNWPQVTGVQLRASFLVRSLQALPRATSAARRLPARCYLSSRPLPFPGDSDLDLEHCTWVEARWGLGYCAGRTGWGRGT